MSPTRHASYCAALWVAAASTVNASTIVTFDVTGVFQTPSPTPLTGTLTFNVDPGVTDNVVVGSDLMVPGFAHFTKYESFAFTSSGAWEVSLGNNKGGNLDLDILPLLNFAGQFAAGTFENVGSFGATVQCTSLTCQTINGYLSGNLVPDFNSIDNVAATPLPATLPLFISGLAILGFVGWKRKSAHQQG